MHEAYHPCVCSSVLVSVLKPCKWTFSWLEHFSQIRSSMLRCHVCRSVLGPFLKSCGFRDSAVRWLPASAPDGQNMTSPPQAPQLAAWWRGPTVVDVIDTFAPGGRAAAALPLRMCVSDLFRTARGQSLIGGKIEVCALTSLTSVNTIVAIYCDAGVLCRPRRCCAAPVLTHLVMFRLSPPKTSLTGADTEKEHHADRVRPSSLHNSVLCCNVSDLSLTESRQQQTTEGIP